MKYIIGEILTKYVEDQNIPYYIFARNCGCSEVEFAAIRNNRRVASPAKLATLIDIENLKEPVLTEIKTLLDTLDTETIINVYNVIYNSELKNNANT